MPNWQHTSATSSPRATFTPTFQITGPLWKNNGFSAADVFAACAEPTPDNQYTTFKPTLRLTRSRFNCVFAACAEPTPHHQYTTFKPTHIHQISFSHMRLPLMRNHLLTTSTPYLNCSQSNFKTRKHRPLALSFRFSGTSRSPSHVFGFRFPQTSVSPGPPGKGCSFGPEK